MFNTQYIIGHIGDDFYRSYDQTNSVKALKYEIWRSLPPICSIPITPIYQSCIHETNIAFLNSLYLHLHCLNFHLELHDAKLSFPNVYNLTSVLGNYTSSR